MIASAGLNDPKLNGKQDYNDFPVGYRGTTHSTTSQLHPPTFQSAQETGPGPKGEQQTQRKTGHGGKSRRGHSNTSHSKNGDVEPKTVGEYALHHLFNAVGSTPKYTEWLALMHQF